ncbi:hypothetical protein AVEN_85304-1 [Araneus ventricosus]|uniref:Uncharacterized protein n=1 Tax=Araneus ventricosus TaxID=182803 RepID=A0A4Y2TBM6_ARAVE|nr:hypothetical protein AVEN_85304-1 [Araneus ventricosus]
MLPTWPVRHGSLDLDNNQTQLSSHSFTLLHSVSRSSLLATARLLTFSELFPVLLRATVRVALLLRSSNVRTPALPLLTAEMNPIQLIVRYFSPCWTQYSSRMEVRRKGGSNDHPTPAYFLQMTRMLLAEGMFVMCVNANCEPNDGIILKFA